MRYLSISQIEHLVKLEKKMTTLIEMTNGVLSKGTSNQTKQNKMTPLIKMDNGVPIKWDILCYVIS